MCVILVFFQVHPDLPLVVGANRDEYYVRPSSGPERLLDSPRTVGGRDVERGGTWMGFSEGGRFAALTNLRTLGPPEPARRSRGEIALQALAAGSIDAVEDALLGTDPRAYNPFNLVFGDGRALRIACAREGDASVVVRSLDPGLHVITNAVLGTPIPKVERAHGLARPLVALPLPPAELVPALQRVLADHALPALEMVPPSPPWMERSVARQLQAVCVHTPAYGTRSSTVATVDPHGVVHYTFAAGPPCTTPFVDATTLLSED